MDYLKVSSKSDPNLVAGALSNIIRETGEVEIQAVGAGAVNQTVKAIAISRNYLAEDNTDIVCTPSFSDITINGETRTALRFHIEEVDMSA